VVLLGYRYSHYNLVDMRIHDINVIADLGATKPLDAPQVVEGEADGSEQAFSPRSVTTVDAHLVDATNAVAIYWTGWWPLLHILVSSPVIFHMAVDLLGNSEVYESSDSGTNEEDFNNAKQKWLFGLEMGLWTLALIITCAVAEKIPTVWLAIAAIAGVMAITLALAWVHSHQLVDNGIWTAGGASWFFLLLSLTYLCMAAGYNKIGGIAAYVLFGFLAFFMKTSIEAIKAAIQLTVWSRVVFVIMAVAFFLYFAHFYAY